MLKLQGDFRGASLGLAHGQSSLRLCGEHRPVSGQQTGSPVSSPAPLPAPTAQSRRALPHRTLAAPSPSREAPHGGQALLSTASTTWASQEQRLGPTDGGGVWGVGGVWKARLMVTPNLTPTPRRSTPHRMVKERRPQAGWAPGWVGKAAGWQVKLEAINEDGGW